MVTISHIVEEEIKRKPFLQEALSRNIINYASLAEIMKPDVERIMKKEVKLSAVTMALRRLAEKLEETFMTNLKFDKETDINLRSNIFEIIFNRTCEVEEKLKKLNLDLSKKDMYSVVMGVEQINVVSNTKYKDLIINNFNKDDILKIYDNLGSITINISMNIVNQSGFFYILTRALAWEGISIVEIISTLTELTFILKDEDLMKGFDSLNKIISDNSN